MVKQQQLDLKEMSKEICLFGASGHGKVVLDVVQSTNKIVIAFFDDKPIKAELNNRTVFQSNEISNYLDKDFIISIGDNMIRKKISNKLNVNYASSIFHSSSVVSETAIIGKGTVVMPAVVINADSRIGKHVIINSAAVIEHDCLIEDYVHISPKSAIAGNVSIGEGAHIGVGANVIPNITIGKWCIVGAGATVIEDVPDYAVVAGVPAKIIKFNDKID